MDWRDPESRLAIRSKLVTCKHRELEQYSIDALRSTCPAAAAPPQRPTRNWPDSKAMGVQFALAVRARRRGVDRPKRRSRDPESLREIGSKLVTCKYRELAPYSIRRRDRLPSRPRSSQRPATPTRNWQIQSSWAGSSQSRPRRTTQKGAQTQAMIGETRNHA
jgi:hypothetical protein